MKASDALELLAWVRATWHLAVPARAEDDLELVIWPNELAGIEYDDAQYAIRTYGASSFAPTVLQIRDRARAEARSRGSRLELPEPDGMTFEQWIEQASEDDLKSLARSSPTLREKFGIDLAEVES